MNIFAGFSKDGINWEINHEPIKFEAGNTAYEHVGAPMDKGALGRIRFMWKPQTFKYTATAPTTPLVGDNALLQCI